MIALQARSPQLPSAAAQTAKFVNMMNMTKQQEAAERQAAQAQQQMTLAQKKDAREEALQGPALTKASAEANSARLKYVMDYYESSKNDLSTARDPQDVIARAERLKRLFPEPELNASIDETVASMPQDPALFSRWRDDTLRRTMDAEKQLKRDYSNMFDAEGRLIIVETSPVGAFSPKVTPGVITDLPSTTPPPSPYTPTAAPQTPSGSARTGKFGEALVVPDSARPLTADQQDHIRRMQEDLGMTDTPASFNRGSMGTSTAGQMTPDMVPAILDSAVDTGVMAQIDLDQMLALAPPQARQGIMDVIRSNNISLQADAPSLAASGMGQQQPPMAPNPVQRPQAQFADMRGPAPQSRTAGLGGDMPMMRNTEAQYQVGQPVKGRNQSMGAYPGSAQVPIERVRQEAIAGRETAGEVYAKEKARAKAQREAALEAGPKPLTSAQEQKLRATITKDYKTVNDTLDQMLNPVTGVVAAVNNVRKLSKSQKEWLVGKTNYLPSLTDAGQTADTRLGNLTGKVTQMGKVLASLGGAIGPMAVQEWNIVRSFIAELDPAQMSPKALEDQLDIIEAAARGAAERISDAYNNQYIEEFARYPGRFQIKGPTQTPVKKNPAESQIPRIKTDAQWNALKPGTLYIAPNGETKRKR
jgi:hypothetical protein